MHRKIILLVAFSVIMVPGWSQVKSLRLLVGLGPAHSVITSAAPSYSEAVSYLHRGDLKPNSAVAGLLADVTPFRQKRLFLQTGLAYSAFTKGNVFKRDVYPINGTSTRLVSFWQEYSWVSVPVHLGYSFSFRHVSPFVFGGIGANYLLPKNLIRERTYIYDSNNNLASYSEQFVPLSHTRLQLSGTAGFGADFTMRRLSGFGFTIQGQYTRFLTATVTNDIREKLRWWNFSLGIKYVLPRSAR